MIKIILPEVLMRVAQLESREFQVHGDLVGDALLFLCAKNPSLTEHLYHSTGALKEHFIISVAGAQGNEKTEVHQGDVVEIMLATSGGMSAPVVDDLSDKERLRYARHLVLPTVGEEGQKRLKRSRVLIVGLGGLGSASSMYLAAGGVGTLGLLDLDQVDESNLQRQVIHGVHTLGQSKVLSAQRRLQEINDLVHVETYPLKLTAENALAIIQGFDLVVDATDNFDVRYAINDACILAGIPFVYGSIHQFDGQISVFNADPGPCYRCLFPAPPPEELHPNRSAPGVIGVLPGVVGTLQAAEAINLLLGRETTLAGRLLRFDALRMNFSDFHFSSRDDCPTCRASAVA